MSLKAKNLVNRVKSFVYLQEDLIGKGASGKVYKGMNQQNSQQVAIKIMQMNKIDNQVTEYLLACQKQALTAILNPYVLHAYEIIQMQDQCLIITPLCSGGTLKQHITSQGKLPEQEALLILVKILRGYVSIKEKGFVHRDIKSSNVMFKNNDPIIIDFGYCQKRTGKKPKMFYNVGSPSYMSPQAYFKTIYSQKSDLWAIGIILYQMLQGYTIDHGQPIDRYFSTLLRHGFIFRSKITQPTKNMIKSMLNPNPNQRPDTEQLIQLTQRIIYTGSHLYHSIQHSQQIKNTKPESYMLNLQNLNHNKISLKQTHKKHNHQQIQQLIQQKLIQSREQYQQIQQLPQKNQQIHKKQALIQQNNPINSKMFENRNKNQQFVVKLSQSIYKPQNSGLTQSTKLEYNYPKIQNIPHLSIRSSQIVKHQPFYGYNQQNMQHASSPQFLQLQNPQQYSSLPFQHQQQQHLYHQNQIIQYNPNYNVIHHNSNGIKHQNSHSNHPQYITNQNPNQIINHKQVQHYNPILHQIQSQRMQHFPTQHPQNPQYQQSFHPKNQQFNPKFPPQQFQHHHTNHRNHEIPQNIKLISNNAPRISINKNQFQINPLKLAPQYHSMIQSPTKNNANKYLNIIQNEKNIKICHSKIFNSKTILTTTDPTKENITHIPSSGQKQHNFKFNNINITDSILPGGEGFKTYQQNLNLLKQSNPVVQSLIFQQQHSLNSSFQSINPVFRSIIVDKQPSSKLIPRSNLHPAKQLRQANQVHIQNFKNIQQFQNVLQVPQFTQIRNSIGHSQQINSRPINKQLPILSFHTQIGSENTCPQSPIARQKIFSQNNQQNKLNININQLERNFFKKTQPYFHMNTNLKEQDHKLRIMPNNIPLQNHQHEVKQQFMNNFMPNHNMNQQNLQQLQRFSQNTNQPYFLARHTMPNLPKKDNIAPGKFPPQKIIINSVHNQHRAYK